MARRSMKEIWVRSTHIMRKHRIDLVTQTMRRIWSSELLGRITHKKGIFMEMGETGFVWVCDQWWSLANTINKIRVS